MARRWSVSGSVGRVGTGSALRAKTLKGKDLRVYLRESTQQGRPGAGHYAAGTGHGQHGRRASQTFIEVNAHTVNLSVVTRVYADASLPC